MKHILGLSIALILLTGCSTTESVTMSKSAWSDEVNDIVIKAQNTPAEAAVADILADQKITQQEIEERATLLVSCMHDAGYADYIVDLKARTHGFSNQIPYTDAEAERGSATEKECIKKIGFLDLFSLYFRMKDNPTHIDNNELMAQCLVKQKVVDPSYSGANFLHDFEKYLREHDTGNGTVEGDPLSGIPYIVSSEEGLQAATTCFTDPQSILKTSDK